MKGIDKTRLRERAWRHRFKTVGIEAAIEHRILDAIQGHRPRNVAEGSGEVTIKTQAAAIAKLHRRFTAGQSQYRYGDI
jgi:hypothetical protein